MPTHSTVGTWSGETDPIDSVAERVRQGDVLRFEVQSHPWESYGIVVTADCDIVQVKNAGIVSYVPVLALADYWRVVALPRDIDKYASSKFLMPARDRIRALQRANLPDFPEALSDQSIDDLIRGNSAEAIISRLRVGDAERSSMLRLVTAYRGLLQKAEQPTLYDLAKQLAELRVANGMQSPDPKVVLDDLCRKVRELPGDAFYLSCIDRDCSEGHVAYLRLVRELRADSIALQPKHLAQKNVVARRVARLRSPFVYRLTQQLAHLFADIGLPAEYEERRLMSAQGVREALGASSLLDGPRA